MSTTDTDFLRRKTRPVPGDGPSVRVVDLFSGCGGLSVGMFEAARLQGRGFEASLAIDVDPIAAETYKRNVPNSHVVTERIEDLFDGLPGDRLRRGEEELREGVGAIDVLLAGPPCQGHSDLNNHTRRRDVRNLLYLRVARAAEVLKPRFVLVENVPQVVHDHEDVVGQTVTSLEKSGYATHTEIVDLSTFGVPQKRRRHLLLASTDEGLDPVTLLAEARRSRHMRTVRWAIEDLLRADRRLPIDLPTTMSPENTRRVEYLFRNRLYDLPDSQRPACHASGEHSYRSSYGRMRWDEPAQTLTTGFGSMGQGRFVHPSRRRTITPHEAARLQTFPDWFDWGDDTTRRGLSTMIGNAVPPMLTLRLGLAALTAMEA